MVGFSKGVVCLFLIGFGFEAFPHYLYGELCINPLLAELAVLLVIVDIELPFAVFLLQMDTPSIWKSCLFG
jgi:hypothetical protein